MNILFSLLELQLEGQGSNMYSDLAEEFHKQGHNVTIVAPALGKQTTGLSIERGMRVLRVKAMESRVVKSTIKKGIALATMPYLFKRAYKKYLSEDTFDLILMPTPPITFVDFVKYVKKETGAKFYLILRDIHPHSFHGFGLFRKFPFVFWFYNGKAQKAYRLADYIGCMSPGNIEFVHSIATQIDKNKVVLLPNWVNYNEFTAPNYEIRKKYHLEGKFVALFGGTIGLGQAVGNIITLAEHYKDNLNIVFLIVGKGTQKNLLIKMAQDAGLSNIIFLDFMPRDEYENLLATADIGLISLDKKYKVPTCPSKVIGYMSQKIPVLAMINKGSDYGQFYIDQSGCGLWSEGGDKDKMFADFDRLYSSKGLRSQMGESGFNYYINNLTTEHIYKLILEQVQN